MQAMVMLLFGCAIMNALHLPHCARLVQVIRGWLASGTVGKLTTAHSLSNVAWGLACLDLLDQQTLRKVPPSRCEYSGGATPWYWCPHRQ
jgi:hypothetical protein